MFSGIIETIGAIRSLRKDAKGARITIEAPGLLNGVRLGDSIALNGVCVTVVDFDERKFEADLSIETLRRTNLGELAVGDGCNLERAMALGERLGGHLVSGHVDGVGRIKSRKNEGDSIWLTFEAPVEVMRYVVYKGSVAVDGISLTVAACESETFSVSIIPHTGEQTTLTVGTQPRYAATGHIVFAREASLWRAPFDVETLALTGPAVPVLEDLQVNSVHFDRWWTAAALVT